jgi:hypothetical protein
MASFVIVMNLDDYGGDLDLARVRVFTMRVKI